MSNVLHILRVVSENCYLLFNFLVLTSDELKQVESEKLLATAKNAHETRLAPRHSHPAHHHVGLREAVRKGRRRESKECLFMCLIKFMKTFLMGVDSQRWGI